MGLNIDLYKFEEKDLIKLMSGRKFIDIMDDLLDNYEDYYCDEKINLHDKLDGFILKSWSEEIPNKVNYNDLIKFYDEFENSIFEDWKDSFLIDGFLIGYSQLYILQLLILASVESSCFWEFIDKKHLMWDLPSNWRENPFNSTFQANLSSSNKSYIQRAISSDFAMNLDNSEILSTLFYDSQTNLNIIGNNHDFKITSKHKPFSFINDLSIKEYNKDIPKTRLFNVLSKSNTIIISS